MTDLKFKAGDHVMVPMKVTTTHDLKPEYLVEFDGGKGFWLPEAALASATLIERPLAVGDMVTWGTSFGLAAGSGCILDIAGGFAIIRRNGSSAAGLTWPQISLSELRRAEERG